jgi:membrane associated rhomboid family serine protease
VIPISDSIPTRRVPWVTIGLIVVNIVVFLLLEPALENQETYFYCNALVPYEVTHQTNLADGGADARAALAEDDGGEGEAAALQRALQRRCPDKSWVLALLVSMFLHGGWLHLGGNMLYLWIFGNNVEDRLGRLPYLGFYLMGGIAADGLQIAFGPSSTVPTVGASGAIAAILGAYLVLFPRARVRTLVFLLVFITWIELPAVVVLGGWFLLQLFSGIGSVGEHGSGVAYWAHVGGFVFGYVVAWLFYRGRRLPGRPSEAGPYRYSV